ncbi:DNA-binding HxlR family transcriptional regulator [Paenibacillus sp. PvP094]|uniref:winged helix-turn-helix transcriptional regulator n=1 Tax=Paenibacillus sp. PvP094 TaxID=3156394 RepID=UPI00339B5E7E
MSNDSELSGTNNLLTPFDYTLSVLGGKWKMKIMYQIACQKILRYGELKRSIVGISHKVLSSQLKELEESGIVNRVEYSQTPPKVEYSLTPRGGTLMPILEEMCKWGMHNLPDEKRENFQQ